MKYDEIFSEMISLEQDINQKYHEETFKPAFSNTLVLGFVKKYDKKVYTTTIIINMIR